MNTLESIDAVRKAQAAKEAEKDAVGQNQFLEMLVAQLENQDPLNPQDSADFAAQLAQFSTVEQLIAMRTGIDELVKTLKNPEEDANAAKKLDPAGLVGREVVVFGRQVEVDAAGSRISLPLRTRDTAVSATIKLVDSKGVVRYERSLLPKDERGNPIALRPGDHTFELDPRAHNLPEGTYRVELSATGTDKKPVTILPMVTGVVTGAVVAGTPAIRIGGRLFGLEDILEVRLAPTGGTGASGASAGSSPAPNEVGGGQSVVRPTARGVSS